MELRNRKRHRPSSRAVSVTDSNDKNPVVVASCLAFRAEIPNIDAAAAAITTTAVCRGSIAKSTARNPKSMRIQRGLWQVLLFSACLLVPPRGAVLLTSTDAFSTPSLSTTPFMFRRQQTKNLQQMTRVSTTTTTTTTATTTWSTLYAHNGKEASSPLHADASSRLLPRHVAIICDGNSRWAQARGLPAAAGHAAGADRLVQVLQTLQTLGVCYCTLYCFSTENWQRPAQEVHHLMRVMEQTARKFRPQVLASRARIKVLGDLDDERIPAGLRNVLTDIEQATAGSDDGSNDGPRQTVCLAINYGGRRDILQAAKRLAEEVITNDDPLSAIGKLQDDDLARHLGTLGIPDPDLLIRTSGEHRLSNFLLWNIAYAEIYFTDTLWPDFDAECIAQALEWYAQRHRRFGSREPAVHGSSS